MVGQNDSECHPVPVRVFVGRGRLGCRPGLADGGIGYEHCHDVGAGALNICPDGRRGLFGVFLSEGFQCREMKRVTLKTRNVLW